MSEEGMCTTEKIKEGDVIVMGRCSSQGSNSALPVKVMRGLEQ